MIITNFNLENFGEIIVKYYTIISKNIKDKILENKNRKVTNSQKDNDKISKIKNDPVNNTETKKAKNKTKLFENNIKQTENIEQDDFIKDNSDENNLDEIIKNSLNQNVKEENIDIKSDSDNKNNIELVKKLIKRKL